jgi:hypothetical protein
MAFFFEWLGALGRLRLQSVPRPARYWGQKGSREGDEGGSVSVLFGAESNTTSHHSV